ncbi:hypothetical protein [Granulicella sp. L46]|uniref:hypothetical protein n=1 Tax=Granulicella sp. L46 TaxID=1641865 RepID=UPI00131BB924|nr:hypothetical protein [Granulicella sp. L46]
MRFSKAFVYRTLLVVAGAIVPARATMLIIIYTPDGYWIGADSARTFDGKRVATVCKVHSTKWGLVLKAGVAAGTSASGESYSTDAQLKQLIDDSVSIEDLEQKLRSQYVRDIDTELAYILNDPNVTAQTVERTVFPTPVPIDLIPAMDRLILLVPNDDIAIPADTLTVDPFSEPLPAPYYGKFRYEAFTPVNWVPVQTLPHKVLMDGKWKTFPDSVQIFSYPVQYDRENSWVIGHPQQAILEILNIGHHEDSLGIGPPYVILHVTRTKTHKNVYHWISKKPCDSWTSDVPPHSFLDRFRNPPL